METSTVGKYTVTVQQDEFAENPREDGYTLGHMALNHRRYNLPWENTRVSQSSPEYFINGEYRECHSWHDVSIALHQSVKDADRTDHIAIILAVYMLDHGGTHMAAVTPGTGDPFGHLYYGFDSGQVGYIYATRKGILECYGGKRVTKAMLDKARKELVREVEDYSAWSNGSVYEYEITDDEGESVHQCGGYYNPYEALQAGVDYAEQLLLVDALVDEVIAEGG